MSATEPTRPAVPEYGEYASQEDVNEARAHRGLDPLPVAAPTTPTPAPAADAATRVPVPTRAETPIGEPAEKTTAAPKSWDRSVSIALLVFGALATIYTAVNAAALPRAMDTLYAQLSVDASYSPGLAQTIVTAVLIGSHAILLAFAITMTNARLRAGKTAFWAPLIAGVVAVIVTIVSYMAFMLSDPNLTAVFLQSAS